MNYHENDLLNETKQNNTWHFLGEIKDLSEAMSELKTALKCVTLEKNTHIRYLLQQSPKGQLILPAEH